MPLFDVLEPAIDPKNRITFLLDWELTMKCNLDCTYCSSGIFGGHDNTTQHPNKDECLRAIDFMFAYADLYMSLKPQGIRYVVLNVYGGEALHHPDIVEILSTIQTKYQPYSDRWNLTVTTTTNAIVTEKKLKNIIPYIDEFTVSYHSDSSPKQKQQFRENLLEIRKSGRRMKCIVMMNNQDLDFSDAQDMINWLIQHNINFLPKQCDDRSSNTNNYNQQQIVWFNKWFKTQGELDSVLSTKSNQSVNLSDTGRACCGGRKLCQDQNYKNKNIYILDNKFTDWYCSVNHFFLYVKQVNGDIYVNKDCKMNFNGQVAPIGNLNLTDQLLLDLEEKINTNTLPIIQCKKHTCYCGLCAPKTKGLEDYKQIMKKYQKEKL
jgi:hypothetical protein